MENLGNTWAALKALYSNRLTVDGDNIGRNGECIADVMGMDVAVSAHIDDDGAITVDDNAAVYCPVNDVTPFCVLPSERAGFIKHAGERYILFAGKWDSEEWSFSLGANVGVWSQYALCEGDRVDDDGNAPLYVVNINVRGYLCDVVSIDNVGTFNIIRQSGNSYLSNFQLGGE